MSHINEDEFKSLLLARADELHALNETTKDDVAPPALDQSAIGRLSRMDALQRQAMSEETRRRRLNELNRIEQALQRLAAGEYGFCLHCGEPIAKARLALDPAVAYCVAHAVA